MANDNPRVIRLPLVFLQLGDEVGGTYPIYFCEAGDNGGSRQIGSVEPAGYEIVCDACQAYNAMRNEQEKPIVGGLVTAEDAVDIVRQQMERP